MTRSSSSPRRASRRVQRGDPDRSDPRDARALDLRQAGLAGDRGQRRQDREGRRAQQLGRYIELQDSTGNIYTYAHLGSIPKQYPVPKPVKLTARDRQGAVGSRHATPKPPASAGAQQTAATPSTTQATSRPRAPRSRCRSPAPASRPHLQQAASAGTSTARQLAAGEPTSARARSRRRWRRSGCSPIPRPASYAAGGNLQLKSAAPQISNFRDYFSDVFTSGRTSTRSSRSRQASIVVAGTILGRIASGAPRTRRTSCS